MRVDALLVVAVAAVVGALAPTAPLPTLLGAGAVGALIARRLDRAARVCVLVAFGAGALRAALAVQSFEVERVAVRDALGSPRRCGFEATVETSPVRRSDTLAYDALAGRLDCDERVVPTPVRLRLYGGPAVLARGDRIRGVAQLGAVRLFRNAELPDPTPRAARSGALLSGGALAVEVVRPSAGLAAWVDRARAHARARIDATFAPAAAPMARALVLGENDIAPDEDAAFRTSGLAHLLAVSGTHLVFAVLSLVGLLQALCVRIGPIARRGDPRRAPALFGAALSLVYADFAGGSGSAWRAAFMLSAALLARGLGRRPAVARSFGLSVLIGWVLDPLVAFDLSFLLSAAATAGLVVIGQPLSRRIAAVRSRALRYVTGAAVATVASMIPCAPLLAGLGPSITLAGVLANVVAAPLGEVVALPLCLLHPLLTLLPSLEAGVALVGSGALRVVAHVAFASADARWSAVPVPPPGAWHFAVLGVGAALLALRKAAVERLVAAAGLVVALGVVEGAAVRAGHPTGVLRVTALDVGQGDATLVDLPDGSLMLVDGGGFVGSPVDPGARVIAPVLRARRRRRVDVVVLSHPHPDHFTGLVSGLAGVEVGELWDSGQGRAEGAGPIYAALVDGLRDRGVVTRGPRDLCGAPRRHAGAEVAVLGPCPDFTPGIDANDNSLVVHVRFGRRAVLLVGDAEAHQEQTLLAAHGAALRADLLKVGHHGSRTSTGRDFVARISPTFATISCGVRNRYGHPHDATLTTLADLGVRVFRLDRTGSVRFWTDGEHVKVAGFSLPR